MDSTGATSSSALIPICAYQGDMARLGQVTSDLPWPVCSSFKPTILYGQLCYTLKVKGSKALPGKHGKLQLLIDHTPTAPVVDFKVPKNNKTKMTMLQAEEDLSSVGQAEVYLSTLSSIRTRAMLGGDLSISLTGLKKMTGTEAFLNLKDSEKSCSLVTFEECQTKHFLEQVQEKCGCLPWTLTSVLQQKVSPFLDSFQTYSRLPTSVPLLTSCVTLHWLRRILVVFLPVQDFTLMPS